MGATTSRHQDDEPDQPIPGTQPLLHLSKEGLHSRQKSKDDSIILIPAPSTQPDDPLNFSPRRKALATASWFIYTFFNGFANSNLYSILTPLSEAQNLPLSVLNAGTGYLFLLAGFGLLFWQPLALQYGKRPVYLASMVGLIGMSLWGPHTNSAGQWYARSVLSGFFASPIEALPEASIAGRQTFFSPPNLYFAHERGTYMGLYTTALVGSNFAGPIICGFIQVGMGWEWVFYWTAIFCGIATVFLFFALEETNFDRNEHATRSLRDFNGQSTDKEKPMDVETRGTLQHSVSRSTTLSDTRRRPLVEGHGKSYWQKLKLKDRHRPFAMHRHLARQLIFLTWPIPLLSGFAYGSVLIWFNVLNGTSSLVLSEPPYNFSASIVGLCYVAPLLGVLAALAIAGPSSDALVLIFARRNRQEIPFQQTIANERGGQSNLSQRDGATSPSPPLEEPKTESHLPSTTTTHVGVTEPEHRLPLYLLTTLTIPLGLLLWGLGSSPSSVPSTTRNTPTSTLPSNRKPAPLPWPALLLGMAFLGFQNALGASLALTYLLDTYRAMAGDALTAVILVRAVMSFAVSYGITPWVEDERLGWGGAFGVAAAVGTLCSAAVVAVGWWKGNSWRRRSRERYWRLVREGEKEGVR
ncbi:MAG: hypothetical protein M1831_001895 [Alyxoria varia]|nr:MAG: hypothetical protein M1831_001895 [Alyxoria varia]